jgi:hypothetical protein
MTDLRNDKRLRYNLVFKNHGEAAGASLEHTHTQLISTPITPKQVQEELDGSLAYFQMKERCVWCDIVEQELAEGNGQRVVLETPRFAAIVPYRRALPVRVLDPAARAPGRVRGAVAEDYKELAGVLRETLQRLNLAPQNPPYNLVIHTAPNRDADHEYYHWHIEIMPKLTKVAGFEWGSGFYINPTPPEDAAAYLTGNSRQGGWQPTRRSRMTESLRDRAGGDGSVAAGAARRPGRRRSPRSRTPWPSAATRHPVPARLPRPQVPGRRAPHDRRSPSCACPDPPASSPRRSSRSRIRAPAAPQVMLVHHRGDRRFFDRPGPVVRSRRWHDLSRQRRALLVLRARRARGPEGARREARLIHAFDPRAAWTLGVLKRLYADDAHFVRTGTVLTALDLEDQEPQARGRARRGGLEADGQRRGRARSATTTCRCSRSGLRHADLVVLPSRRYAADVVETEGARRTACCRCSRSAEGHGRHRARHRRAAWDPSTDSAIAALVRHSDPAARPPAAARSPSAPAGRAIPPRPAMPGRSSA